MVSVVRHISFGVVSLFSLFVISQQQSPTTAPLDICTSGNKTTCGDCVGFSSAKCLWCPTKNPPCMDYPAGDVFPNGVCPLTEARWLNCWVNFQALLISIGVLAAALLLGITLCVYCCCCRTSVSRLSRRDRREEERAQQDRADRQAKHTERKADRQAKYDEIRQKYGLSGGGGGSSQYSRFENEADA